MPVHIRPEKARQAHRGDTTYGDESDEQQRQAIRVDHEDTSTQIARKFLAHNHIDRLNPRILGYRGQAHLRRILSRAMHSQQSNTRHAGGTSPMPATICTKITYPIHIFPRKAARRALGAGSTQRKCVTTSDKDSKQASGPCAHSKSSSGPRDQPNLTHA